VVTQQIPTNVHRLAPNLHSHGSDRSDADSPIVDCFIRIEQVPLLLSHDAEHRDSLCLVLVQ
jgi:hypothetical protein